MYTEILNNQCNSCLIIILWINNGCWSFFVYGHYTFTGQVPIIITCAISCDFISTWYINLYMFDNKFFPVLKHTPYMIWCASPRLASGLTYGTAYTFTVTAANFFARCSWRNSSNWYTSKIFNCIKSKVSLASIWTSCTCCINLA